MQHTWLSYTCRRDQIWVRTKAVLEMLLASLCCSHTRTYLCIRLAAAGRGATDPPRDARRAPLPVAGTAGPAAARLSIPSGFLAFPKSWDAHAQCTGCPPQLPGRSQCTQTLHSMEAGQSLGLQQQFPACWDPNVIKMSQMVISRLKFVLPRPEKALRTTDLWDVRYRALYLHTEVGRKHRLIWNFDVLEVEFRYWLGINSVQGKAEIHFLLAIVDMCLMIAIYS